MTKTSFLFLLGLLVGMLGCGKSEISKNLKSDAVSASSSSTSRDPAVTAIPTVPDAKLNLWVSPVRDSTLSALKANDNLENLVNKNAIPLYGLQIGKGLNSEFLKVQNAENDSFSPNYGDWKNKNISWDRIEFQNFMGFAFVSRGIERALDLFRYSLITAKTNSSGQNIFPLKLYVNECCDATQTGYDPLDRVILFYKHGGQTLPYFNMIDEGDVALHEFGHVLQHTLNRNVLEMSAGANPSVDALLEALSDFYAAAVLRTDNTFPYLGNNISYLISATGNRTGPLYKRKVLNSLKFPDHYTADAHLDGRIIAASLNDIRQYFEGGVYPVGCSSSSCYLQNTSFKLSNAQAYDQTARLAHMAYALMVTSSSLHQYASLVVSEWKNRLAVESGLCGSNATCKNAVANAMISILRARGLMSSLNNVNASVVDNPPLSTPGNFSFVGFTASGMADTDNLLEPCEVVMVYPNLINPSSSSGVDWVDGLVELNSYSGFIRAANISGQFYENVKSITQYEEELRSDSQAARPRPKLIPWLGVGQSTSDLIANTASRIYQQSPLGSTFVRPLSLSYYPSAVGWILRAPASGMATVEMTYELRPYNATGNYWLKRTITQRVSVSTSAGTTNFCTQHPAN